MRHYELVLLLDASAQDKQRQEFLEGFEKTHKDIIVKKDDIGITQTVFNLGRRSGNSTFQIVSYYLKATPLEVEELKKGLLYNKLIVRSVVFAMKASDEMFMFHDLHKQLEVYLETMKEKKMIQKVTFFLKPENKKYAVWKSIPILKKYMTRFGNIKPRKYTGNPVSVQKNVREAIQRARELGLMEYIK